MQPSTTMYYLCRLEPRSKGLGITSIEAVDDSWPAAIQRAVSFISGPYTHAAVIQVMTQSAGGKLDEQRLFIVFQGRGDWPLETAGQPMLRAVWDDVYMPAADAMLEVPAEPKEPAPAGYEDFEYDSDQ